MPKARTRSFAVLAAIAVAGCSSPQPGSSEATHSSTSALTDLPSDVRQPIKLTIPELQRRREAMALAGKLPTASPGPLVPMNELAYWGGPVISDVQIVDVNWGPNVNATVVADMPGFYQAVVASKYLTWLEEYDTIGITAQDMGAVTGQHIGAASYKSAVTITPMNPATTLTETQIGQEIVAQITAGVLPAPTTDAKGYFNTIYMIDFPSGYTETLAAGGITSTSCQQFCAFHFSITYQGQPLPYGVHPDLITDCPMICGVTAPAIAQVESVHSHELAEAITDTAVGAADLSMGYVRPCGWGSNSAQPYSGEIGDICDYVLMFNANDSTDVPGHTVQFLWSNNAGACIGNQPVCSATAPPPNCLPCQAQYCLAPTPVCETTGSLSGDCVQCNATNSSACTGGTPFCNATTDTCRACTAADCSGVKPACETTGPKAGQCVQCTATNKTLCTGATPVCDPTTNTCVACVTNMDCSGATPFCNTTTNTCRACMASDCTGAKPVCQTSGTLAGQCVQCDASNASACTGGTPVCDSTTNACRACLSNADCKAPTPVCDTGSDSAKGQCVACIANSDCPSGDTCNTTTHTCGAAAGMDGGNPFGGDGGNPSGGSDGGGGNNASGGSSSNGCSCRTAGGGSPAGPAGGLALVGAALVLARRRRSKKRGRPL